MSNADFGIISRAHRTWEVAATRAKRWYRRCHRMPISRRDFLLISGTAVAVASRCSAPDDGSAIVLDDAGVDDAATYDAIVVGPDAAADAAYVDVPRTDARDASIGADAGFDARADARADVGPDAGLDARPDVTAPRCRAPADAPVRRDVVLGSLPLREGAFPLGVMAGDMLATRAMIWTRYDGSARVVARVVEVNGDDQILDHVLDRVVSPTPGGFVHLDVTGLTPARIYRYAFLEQEAGRFTGRSRIGRFRTPPADDDNCGVVTFGGTSCSHRNGAPLAALSQAADDDLDFFIHCGDHIYADDRDPAVTLAEYRGKYADYWRLQGMNDLHASTGLYTTWDDHEVRNNWNPELLRDAQIDAATRAFFEHRAFRRSSVDPDRIWRKFQWGRAIELFILDARSERRPSTRLTPDAQFLSREQLQWLQTSLRNSTAAFKFVVTSKPITDRLATTPAEDSDFWAGYPAQRERLLRSIVDNRVEDVWFLSGDVHYGCITHVNPTGSPYHRFREVYMGPSGSGDPGLVDCNAAGQNEVVVRRLNYTRFRADPGARSLEVDFIGTTGAVICGRRYAL